MSENKKDKIMKILNLFRKRKNKEELIEQSIEDQQLIDIAKKMLLNRIVSASNGGGGFDNVKLIECIGIEFGEKFDTKRKYRRVRFKTNDSWITGVSYEDDQIMNMYNKYLETGELPCR